MAQNRQLADICFRKPAQLLCSMTGWGGPEGLPMRTTAPPRLRRHLHFDALVLLARRAFDKLPEPRRCPSFTLADTLMAGLALFSLKDPSLLAFQHRALDHNLRAVFGLQAIPSDTQMRTILDDVNP